MKVLCIGDSLTLPGHLNTYEDTWICRLKKRFPAYDFITFFQRGITTDVLVTAGGGDAVDGFPQGADCLEFYMPDVVVVQLGIVDCAPRFLRKRSLLGRGLSVLPGACSAVAWKIVKKCTRRSLEKADVPPARFEANLVNYLRRCRERGVKKAVLIEICRPGERMVSRNPGILEAVGRYNASIRKVASHYPFAVSVAPLVESDPSVSIYQDGYHPNRSGHERVYAAVAACLEA